MREKTVLLLFCFFIFLSGCTYKGYENSILMAEPNPTFREGQKTLKGPAMYRTELRDWSDIYKKFRELKRRAPPFVGVAISGGGSRAANFGAAVLQELNDLGILAYVTAISSVSGGSLPAAYYAKAQNSIGCLTKPTGEIFDDMKKVMQKNFYLDWKWKFLWPPNWFRFAFTDFNRSDLMAEVFDDQLLGGEMVTFKSIECSIPRIFINSTEVTRGGNRFTYSAQTFEEIGSELSSYPLSHAVMASSAFPGVFRTISLRNYNPDTTVTTWDIGNAPLFAKRLLNGQREVEKYLRSLVPSHLDRLKQKLNSQDIAKELASVLNILICQSSEDCASSRISWFAHSIYKKDPFENVTLSKETHAILNESADPSKYRVLNRLLLEDIFPEFFLKKLPQQFIHLIDGGPADNLGVETLADAVSFYGNPYEYDDTYQGETCLFIVIDAFPGVDKMDLTYMSKTRTAKDLLIDTNILDATDSMLQTKRKEVLKHIGLGQGEKLEPETLRNIAIGKFPLDGNFDYPRFRNKSIGFRASENMKCLSWHISFDRLIGLEWYADSGDLHIQEEISNLSKSSNDELLKINRLSERNAEELRENLRESYVKLHKALSAIETHFFLTGPLNCNESQIQELIYTAAKVLVHDDKKSLKSINEFFSSSGINLNLDLVSRSNAFPSPFNLKTTREGVKCKNVVVPFGDSPNDVW